jgi:alpha-1,3/alpha-1,6-mannosyltransferase
VTENRQYHAELESLASDLKLSHASARTLSTALAIPPATEVLFFLSAPNAAKQALLHSASLLLYTPSNEHFGIVPLEAMRAGTPVLAADNGGPTETVEDGVTGWLRDPEDVPAWTGIIEKVLDGMSAAERAKMGEAGRERVRTRFAEGIMAERLDGIFDQIMDRQRDKPGNGEGEPLDMVVVVTAVVIAVGSTVAIMVISRL